MCSRHLFISSLANSTKGLWEIDEGHGFTWDFGSSSTWMWHLWHLWFGPLEPLLRKCACVLPQTALQKENGLRWPWHTMRIHLPICLNDYDNREWYDKINFKHQALWDGQAFRKHSTPQYRTALGFQTYQDNKTWWHGQSCLETFRKTWCSTQREHANSALEDPQAPHLKAIGDSYIHCDLMWSPNVAYCMFSPRSKRIVCHERVTNMVRSLCAKMFWNQNLQTETIHWLRPYHLSTKVLETPKLLYQRQFHRFVESFWHILTSAFFTSNSDWLYRSSSLVKLRAAAISAPKQQEGSREIDLESTNWIIERFGLRRFSLIFSVFSGIFSPQSQGVETQPLHVPRCYKPSLQVLHHDDHNRVAGPPKYEQSMTKERHCRHLCFWCFGSFGIGAVLPCWFMEAMASAGSQSSSKLQPVHSAFWMLCILSNVSSKHHLK